ncbi:MAG: NUDIX hydrolase [Clostridia bacterium]|jgi:8-oxo-dGTP pyrophosphatase MutT (NUDIX family)|nr:NUDIX hydrolase [Clostridia bacterium]
MWVGGARVVIFNDRKEVLMVKHHQDGKDIWLVPGGSIEEGENALEAARREVLEETGLNVEIGKMLWHVEEVSPRRGQRFVNFFLGEVTGGTLVVGQDPERGVDHQVVEEVRYVSRDEMQGLEVLYPEYLKNELWELLERKDGFLHTAFKVR